MGWTKIGLFALGTLFGSAGIKVLSSRDVTQCHFILRAGCVMRLARIFLRDF